MADCGQLPNRMVETQIASLGSKYRDLFTVLQDAGFTTSVELYSPESFGNFVVRCKSPLAELRVTNDRGQIFIDVKTDKGQWLGKERILESSGIAMSRYKTINGLWQGYEPDIQASDLKDNLPLLIAAANVSSE